jgi:tripartite-type tricarboxylate transporter receptor subunit TctC
MCWVRGLQRKPQSTFSTSPIAVPGRQSLIWSLALFGILGPTALLPDVRTGALMFIAQTGEKRSAVLPDVPTLVEAGYKGMVLESWFGLFAPAGTAADVITALNTVTGKALEDPVLRENFVTATLEAVGGPPEELGKIARFDSDKYARLVKELSITAD